MLTPEAAVQRCIAAYSHACELDDARNDHSTESLQRVNTAFRRSMPFLTNDPDAIDAFIACVTHGLVLEIIPLAEASKLLYAAQVAIGSRRARQQAARDEARLHPTPTPSPAPSPAQELSAPAPPSPADPPPSQTDPASASSLPSVSSSSMAGDPTPPFNLSEPAMPPLGTAIAAPTNLSV